MKEIWKDIIGYETAYRVSSLGRVKSMGRVLPCLAGQTRAVPQQIITPKNHTRYHFVVLSLNGFRKQYYIHRLVASAFIPNPLSKPEVNHINGDRHDNRKENLEWMTTGENRKHARDNGLLRSGIKHWHSKPVLKYSLEGEFICEYINSQTAAKDVNAFSGNIRNVCLGKTQTVRGYKWKYKNPKDVNIVFQRRYVKSDKVLRIKQAA